MVSSSSNVPMALGIEYELLRARDTAQIVDIQ